MKKLLVGFGFSLALSLISFSLQAQTDSQEPGMEGGGNSYGGVCCQSFSSCNHPSAGKMYSSTLTENVSVCE